MNRILIAGSTGMIGKLIVEQGIKSDQVGEIVTLVRKPSSNILPDKKVKEVVISDFEDYTNTAKVFQDIDAAFFCIGVYTGQVADELFRKITVDYALAFAKQLKERSPKATFCLLSGQGADRTEKSRTAFARYKGMAENQIDELGLIFYTFRPGYIYPVEKRKEPNLMYRIIRWGYPMLKLMGENVSIKSTELAAAMLHVGLNGADKQILENRDIKAFI